jgi:hypothetical protein
VTRNHRPKGYKHSDEVNPAIVRGLIDGDISHKDATVAERRAAVQALYYEGYSDTYIAQQTSIPRGSVQRIRDKFLELPANYDRGRPTKEGD